MLITADTIVTMDPERRVLEPGWVLTDGPTISAIGRGEPPPYDGPARHAGLVLPGLISAHQHIIDGLLAGLDPGSQFLDWLLGLYYAGLTHARPEDCGLITELVMSQMLCAGITTVVDCWGVDNGEPDQGRVRACAEASISAHERSGARVVFARMFVEQVPDGWRGYTPAFDVERLCAPADISLERIRELAGWTASEGSGRVRVTPMPELPELVTADGFRSSFALAQDLGVVLPTHLCASPTSREACGPEQLDQMGALGPGLLGAHCIAVDDADVRALAAARVGVAHCPTANQMFPGGTTPVAAFRDAGAAVGLGLDNATLNPRIDLLAEGRAAIVAARSRGHDLDADDVLAMATCDGAEAIGMADRIGSLTPGRRADLVLVDTSGEHWVPRADWSTAIVWRAQRGDVRTVIVDGHVVVEEGVCLTSSPQIEAVARASERLRAAVLSTRDARAW